MWSWKLARKRRTKELDLELVLPNSEEGGLGDRVEGTVTTILVGTVDFFSGHCQVSYSRVGGCWHIAIA